MKSHTPITALFTFAICLLLSGCGPDQLFGPTITPTPTLTNTPSPSPTSTITNTPLPTSTPMPVFQFDADVIADVRSSPMWGEEKVGELKPNEPGIILGQYNDCEWLFIRTPNNVEGWVAAYGSNMSTSCESIAAKVPPPSPTPDLRPKIVIDVINKTRGNVTLNLSGPEEYDFEYTPLGYAWKILPGTYEYIMTGCKGAKETGTITFAGDTTWTLECTIK